MKIEELSKDTKINKIVEKLFNNENFVNSCRYRVKLICEDNVINTSDIPNIIGLLICAYKERENLKISKQNLPDVLKLFLGRLITELKINGIDDEAFNFAVDSSFALANLTIESGVFRSLKNKVLGCVANSSTTIDDDLANFMGLKINRD
jgi:hypothetical protein